MLDASGTNHIACRLAMSAAVMPSKQARLCGVAHTLLFAVKGSFLGVEAQDAAARISAALTEEGPMPPAHSSAARIV